MKSDARFTLIHDLVEIHAGDTYAFDTEGRKGKAERELAAARRLFAGLPAELEQEFLELFLEFEARETREARFVKSFDRLQALHMNVISDGEAHKRKGITPERIDAYMRPAMEHSELMTRIYETLFSESKRQLSGERREPDPGTMD